MILWVVIFSIICPINVRADIFTSNKDQELTSAFNDPYKFAKSSVNPLISWQIDRNKEIKKSITNLARINVDKNIGSSPLLLWEYSAPAEADVYKHLDTIAHLRLALDYARIKDLEVNDRSDLNMLRKQAINDCVQKKRFSNRSYSNDIAGLLDSCQNELAFKDLDVANGANLYEKILNKVHISGAPKKRILPILPIWKVDPNGISLEGAQKRIGHILIEFKNVNIDAINKAIMTYKTQKKISSDKLEALSLPNKPFTTFDVLSLLSLEVVERTKHINAIAAQLAISQTTDQYSEAIEWMGRYINHPNLEDVYKNILQKGIVYLEGEKDSLKEKLEDIKDYSSVVAKMVDEAKAEQQATMQEIRAQETYKAMLAL